MNIIHWLQANVLRYSTAALQLKDYELAKKISVAKHTKASNQLIKLLMHKELVFAKLQNSNNRFTRWYHNKVYQRVCVQEQDLRVKLLKYLHIATISNEQVNSRPYLKKVKFTESKESINHKLSKIINKIASLKHPTLQVRSPELLTNNLTILLQFRSHLLQQIGKINDIRLFIHNYSLRRAIENKKLDIDPFLEQNSVHLEELANEAIHHFDQEPTPNNRNTLISMAAILVDHLKHNLNARTGYDIIYNLLASLQSRLDECSTEELTNQRALLGITEPTDQIEQKLAGLLNNPRPIFESMALIGSPIAYSDYRASILDVHKLIVERMSSPLTTEQLKKSNRMLRIIDALLNDFHRDLTQVCRQLTQLDIAQKAALKALRDKLQLQNVQNVGMPLMHQAKLKELIAMLEQLIN